MIARDLSRPRSIRALNTSLGVLGLVSLTLLIFFFTFLSRVPSGSHSTATVNGQETLVSVQLDAAGTDHPALIGRASARLDAGPGPAPSTVTLQSLTARGRVNGLTLTLLFSGLAALMAFLFGWKSRSDTRQAGSQLSRKL